MKSLRGIAVVAVCGAFTVGGVAVGQDADCNVNGIPDVAEIAAGLVGDCNGNGVPDPCEYATVALEAEINPFGSGNPLVVPIDKAPHAISDMRISIAVRADLDGITEIVQAYVGNTVIATFWITGGQACPAEPQLETVIVPMATVNTSIDANGGDLIVTLEASGAVSVKECPSSFATMRIEYISDVAHPDCLDNGLWDTCDIAADPGLDCDGNGLIDLCEIESNPGLDCDENGQMDSCEIASDSALDCDGNEILDSCDIAANPTRDCDGNGLIDSCEIASDSSLDCDGNGILDSCDIAASPTRDCDGNGQIDTCELAADPTLDCDSDGVVDVCQIAGSGVSCTLDCDTDGVLDACQIALNSSFDKNGDGVLDSCEYDRGDLTLDGSVDGADLAFQLALWGSNSPPIGDMNADGIINGADLAELLALWGEVPAFVCPRIEAASPPVGPPSGGTSITITGKRLSGVVAVTIGGTPATNVVAVDANTITAVTPPSETIGSKNIVVTTTLGTAILEGGFLYSAVAEWATVLEVAPNPTVITDSEWRDRIAATGLPWRVRDNASQVEMLLIPPGTFMMGCSGSEETVPQTYLSNGCYGPELPIHEVTLTQAFYLGRYEVTQAQWTAVYGSNPSSFQSASAQVPITQVPNRPVENIDGGMIGNFLGYTGLRLPTEAEWEYACRAGTQTAYNLPPDGTNADSQRDLFAWYPANAASQTRPVGQKLANNLGLHDMHGNVWEWCADWYWGNYYSMSPPADPPGPSSPLEPNYKVVRGGGWASWVSDPCRVSSRREWILINEANFLGIRVARTP